MSYPRTSKRLKEQSFIWHPLLVLALCVGMYSGKTTHAGFDEQTSVDNINTLLPPGRYLLKTKVVAEAVLPVIGRVDSTTRTLAWVDIRHRSGQVIGQQKVCQVSMGDERDLARTIFPDSLIQALPEKQIHFELSPAAIFPMRLHVDLGEETMGYTAISPGAPLPQSAQSAELVDIDKDGKPGATLFLDLPGIGRYPLGIVSKGHTLLEGWLDAPGFASGNATLLKFQQRVLFGLPVDGEVRDIKGVPERSSFELAPIAPEMDCAGLMASGLPS